MEDITVHLDRRYAADPTGSVVKTLDELAEGDRFMAGPQFEVTVTRVGPVFRGYGRFARRVHGTTVECGRRMLADVTFDPDARVEVLP